MIIIFDDDDLKESAQSKHINDIVLVRDLKSFGNFTPLMLLFAATKITLIKGGVERIMKDVVCILPYTQS